MVLLLFRRMKALGGLAFLLMVVVILLLRVGLFLLEDNLSFGPSFLVFQFRLALSLAFLLSFFKFVSRSFVFYMLLMGLKIIKLKHFFCFLQSLSLPSSPFPPVLLPLRLLTKQNLIMFLTKQSLILFLDNLIIQRFNKLILQHLHVFFVGVFLVRSAVMSSSGLFCWSDFIVDCLLRGSGGLLLDGSGHVRLAGCATAGGLDGVLGGVVVGLVGVVGGGGGVACLDGKLQFLLLGLEKVALAQCG